MCSRIIRFVLRYRPTIPPPKKKKKTYATRICRIRTHTPKHTHAQTHAIGVDDEYTHDIDGCSGCRGGGGRSSSVWATQSRGGTEYKKKIRERARALTHVHAHDRRFNTRPMYDGDGAFDVVVLCRSVSYTRVRLL